MTVAELFLRAFKIEYLTIQLESGGCRRHEDTRSGVRADRRHHLHTIVENLGMCEAGQVFTFRNICHRKIIVSTCSRDVIYKYEMPESRGSPSLSNKY